MLKITFEGNNVLEMFKPLRCHDRDIPPHPVHPQSRLHAALSTLNSP